jgi:hypothetical protein
VSKEKLADLIKKNEELGSVHCVALNEDKNVLQSVLIGEEYHSRDVTGILHDGPLPDLQDAFFVSDGGKLYELQYVIVGKLVEVAHPTSTTCPYHGVVCRECGEHVSVFHAGNEWKELLNERIQEHVDGDHPDLKRDYPDLVVESLLTPLPTYKPFG